MTETVTLQNDKGRPIGKARIISNPEHYPEQIMAGREPHLFSLHHIRNGHLFYRPSPHTHTSAYIPTAETLQK